jgi:predicted porin
VCGAWNYSRRQCLGYPSAQRSIAGDAAENRSAEPATNHRDGRASNAANGCADASAGTCAGELHDASLVADYHFTKRFDSYAGVNYSLVQNGLASGFLFTNVWAPMIGIRFNF